MKLTITNFILLLAAMSASSITIKPAMAQQDSAKKVAAVAAKPAKAKVGFTVGSLKRDDFVPQSCGCAFYSPTSKREDGPMLMFINQNKQATIKLDGAQRNMTVIKEERVQMSNKPAANKIAAGDKLLMSLKADDLTASISSTADRNCTVGEQCNLFSWQSSINLSEGDARKTVKAWSVCGCPGRKIFRAVQEAAVEE
jgi:hypothetical protein